MAGSCARCGGLGNPELREAPDECGEADVPVTVTEGEERRSTQVPRLPRSAPFLGPGGRGARHVRRLVGIDRGSEPPACPRPSAPVPALRQPCGRSSPEPSPSRYAARSRAPYRISAFPHGLGDLIGCRGKASVSARAFALGTCAPRPRGSRLASEEIARRKGARKSVCRAGPGPCSIPPGTSIGSGASAAMRSPGAPSGPPWGSSPPRYSAHRRARADSAARRPPLRRQPIKSLADSVRRLHARSFPSTSRISHRSDPKIRRRLLSQPIWRAYAACAPFPHLRLAAFAYPPSAARVLALSAAH